MTPASHGAWNMAVDEAVLEHTSESGALPTLRLYEWEPACLSLGYAQPFADIDVIRLDRHGWEAVRRPTGGRAILHTDELTYSVIAQAQEPLMLGSVLESYNRLAGALLRAVKALGLAVEMKGDRGSESQAANPVCFEVPSAYEITVAGKKLIGSAQARRKEGVLQHGSLPLMGDLARITEVLVFADDSTRMDAAQRLLARATTIESALGHPVLWNDVAQAFIWAFEVELGIRLERGELSSSEQNTAENLVHEKYNSPAWTQRV